MSGDGKEKKIYLEEHLVRDSAQQDALAAATSVICGLRDSAIVVHASSGCGWKARWNRQDQALLNYTPIIATSLLENDVIFGAKNKLKRDLEFVLETWKPKQLFVIVGDSGSLINDPVEKIVGEIKDEHGVPSIILDVPGFKGLEATGTDIALSAIVNHFAEKGVVKKKGGAVNLVAPNLMGSSNWVYDLEEIRGLLERIGLTINSVLTCNTPLDSIKGFGEAEANIYLTSEELLDFSLIEQEMNIRRIGFDLPLPIGVSNTEDWIRGIAREFDKSEAAEKVLQEDLKHLSPLRYSYNTTWLTTWFENKNALVIGPALWAASFAKFLYHDITTFPAIIALYGETEESLTRAREILRDVTDYYDPLILDNPLYYQVAEAIKDRPVEYGVGQTQDKSLIEGQGVAHLTMAGLQTVLGSFNFVPYPFVGYKGVSYLLTMMGKVLERAFHEPQRWKDLKYVPRDEC